MVYLNAVFKPQEQVSPAQIDLLVQSDLPWDGKKNTSKRR